jgi:HK97 family phage major capsid protein
MAISSAKSLSDFSGFLDREQSAPIFERATRASVVQQLARQIPMGVNGTRIPVVTGRMTANWVGEGEQKSASEGALSLKTMDPKKIATIAVVSAEVVRSNPGDYMNIIQDQVGEAFGRAFDSAALHGTNSPFTTFLDQSSKSLELGTALQTDGGIHRDIVDSLSLLVNDQKRLNGFAMDEVVEPLLLGAVDANGRPIYIETPLDSASVALPGPLAPASVRAGRLLGRASFLANEIAGGGIVGYAGDWNEVAWGNLGGISYKVSTEATVTINGELVSLFENNLVAVLAEAEYGWLVNDPEAFVKFSISES